LFYERDNYLIAIQFVFTDQKTLTESFTDPKIFGPVNTYYTTNVIDEITLNFQEEEEIYLINGYYENDKIYNMGIYTTLGQFVEFGRTNLKPNFSWEFYYNLRNFDGFIVGWTNQNINYLGSLSVEKTNIKNADENIILTDTTYDSKCYLVEPIYLSTIYGKISPNTSIEDEIMKLNIMNEIKLGTIYLSSVLIYYDKYINCFEVEYTKKENGEKLKYTHVGIETKKNKDKKASIVLEKDDFINFMRLTYGTTINSILLKTFKGKSLSCMSYYEGEFKAELCETSPDKMLCILGFIIGYNDTIHSIECYYEKKYV